MGANLYGDEYRDLVNQARGQAIKGPDDLPTGFAENFGAAFDSFMFEDLSVSGGRNFMREAEDQFRLVEELTGGVKAEELSDNFQLPFRSRVLENGRLHGAPGPIARDWIERNGDRLAELKKQHPDAGLLTVDEIKAKIAKEGEAIRTRRAQVAARATGWGVAGQFVGSMSAAMTDPVNIVAMAVEAPIAIARQGSLLSRTLKAAGISGGISAAAEATIQPFVYNYKQEIGSEYTAGDAFANLGYAFAGGTLFGGAIPIGQAAIGKIRSGYGRLVDRYRQAVADGDVTPTPETEAAAEALRDGAEVFEGSPFPRDDTAGQAQHVEAFNQAVDDVSHGRPTTAEAMPDTAPPQGLVSLGPDEIEVDARRFQFKQGGDEFGVSERLQGVTRFDPTQANVSLVWEAADGTRYIVDGHQRLALARRSLANGQDPGEVRLNAIILRETDGATAADARRIAALKNISEGTGTALDAAKVLREVGGSIDDLNLPPNSALVRDAQGLAKLGDEAFQAAVNEVVEPRYAALVGQALAEPKEQMAALQVLKRTEPPNATQAQAIVDQVKAAGFERQATGDLFGETEIAESLFKERARVLDHALRKIRKDRATFKTLVDREDAIAGAGNILDQNANARRLDASSMAMAQLSRSANTAGPISEALGNAARRLKNGEPLTKIADEFADTVRGNMKTPKPPPPPTAKPGAPIRKESMSRAEFKEAEREFVSSQIEWDLDQAYAKARKNQRTMAGVAKVIEDSMEGVEFKNPGIKKRATAAGKIVRNNLDTAGEMTDIVRGGFFVDTPEKALEVAKRITQKFPATDEGLKVTPLGYTDIKLGIKFKNGQVGEIQIWSPEIGTAKFTRGEDLYVEARDLGVKQPDGSMRVPEENMGKYNALMEESRELYAKAVADGSDAWRARILPDLDADMLARVERYSGGSSSPKVSKNSERDIGSPRRSTTAGDTGPQSSAPRLSTQPESPPSGSRTVTAGRLSSDANVTALERSSILSSSDESITASPDILKDAERILTEDPDLEIPAGIRVNEDGDLVAETMTLREAVEEIDDEAGRIDDLARCWGG